MMRLLVILLGVIAATATNNDCEPFGTRVFFGRIYTDFTDGELLNLKFNTNAACPGSYVLVRQGLLTQTFACSSERLEVTNVTTFVTFVHSCSLTNLKSGSDIEYSVFGVDAINGRTHQYLQKSFNIIMVDPTADAKNQFVALADWSPIITKNYTPVINSLEELARTNRTSIHGVLVQGDIGYDLDSN